MLNQLSRSRGAYIISAVILAALLSLPGMSLYYRLSGGKACARCHEIWQPYTDLHTSAHRSLSCPACHGDVLTLEAGYHWANIRRLVTHLRGNVPEQIRIKGSEVFRVAERCRQCHQQEWADWAASLHSATYAEIFLNQTHNQQRRLMDDCLRCHGMHVEGGIRDLVTPLDTTGPWRLIDAGLASRPTIPCLTCHQMHREGLPLERPAVKPVNPGPSEEITRPSLALFDRRELEHVSVRRLSLPAMQDGPRRVRLSPDSRQALCYQCHAPEVSMQVGSSMDRTPLGVHEGFSCLACHEKHGMKTRASCANCHPRLSNCGLDVETMDTTFKSIKSEHNIHFVKCVDCHKKGIPRRREGGRPLGLTAEVQ